MEEFFVSLSYSIYSSLFIKAYYYLTFGTVVLMSFYFMHRDDEASALSFSRITIFPGLLIALIIILLFTFFPIQWGTYADREGYLLMYSNISTDDTSDVGFNAIMSSLHFMGLGPLMFLAVLAIIYVALRYVAAVYLCRNYHFVLFMVIASSFMFIGYGINTMRAGIASSIILIGIVNFDRGSINRIVAILLMLFAITIHRSMIIPTSAFLLAHFVTAPRFWIVVWCFSFIISYFAGNYFSNIFGDIASETISEQAGGYLLENGANSGYKTGFRIDFILYSLAPIIVGAYYIFRKEYRSDIYNKLFCTYIIANVFFVLVVRANFVDRFGYLSWMLMPIILIYPILDKKLFDRNNIAIAMILFFNALFTFGMYLRG